MTDDGYVRKQVMNSDSEETVCQTCFWLLMFVGGDCGCALRYPWPSETNGECKYFVENWDTMENVDIL